MRKSALAACPFFCLEGCSCDPVQNEHDKDPQETKGDRNTDKKNELLEPENRLVEGVFFDTRY